MKRIMIFVLLIIFPIAVNAQEKFDGTSIGIAAVVNDDAVTSADVAERLKLTIISSGLSSVPDIEKKLYPQIVRALIDEQIYKQEAKKQKITISSKEMDDAILSLEEKNHLKSGSFSDFLASKGLSIDTVKKQLEAQLLWNKIVKYEVRPKVSVSEREVEEKMEYIGNNAGVVDLNLSEIVLDVDTPEDDGRIKSLAEKLVGELRKGGDFASVARQFSTSSTASEGGNIGWIQESHLSESIRSTITNMLAGEVSDPVRTPEGYYIIKLNEKRALVNPAKGETEIGIKQAFIPLEKNMSEESRKKEINNVQELRNNLKSCGEFDKFAKDAGSTVDSKMAMTLMNQLNSTIAEVVSKTAVGQVTPVIQSSSGLHVIMVCEKTEAKKTIAEKDKIKEMLFQKKIELQAKRYLHNLRRIAFIEVRG